MMKQRKQRRTAAEPARSPSKPRKTRTGPSHLWCWRITWRVAVALTMGPGVTDLTLAKCVFKIMPINHKPQRLRPQWNGRGALSSWCKTKHVWQNHCQIHVNGGYPVWYSGSQKLVICWRARHAFSRIFETQFSATNKHKKQIGALQTFVLLCQLLSAETPPKSGQFFLTICCIWWKR